MVDLVKILKTKNGPWEAFRALLLGVCRKFPASDSKPKVVLVNGPWDENTEISVSLQVCILLALYPSTQAGALLFRIFQ